MRIVTTIPQHDLAACRAAAAEAEARGFGGIATLENRHDPFLPLAVAATATARIELATGVALAFVRSPMSTANLAWDLNAASAGRFVLGLGAMDAIKANGVDVGHIVHFCVNSPYRLPLDDHDQHHLCLLRAGDLVASEDLAEALDKGEAHIVERDGEHLIVDAEGKTWKPRLPWMEE